jgi:small subunit ribosomal protein S4e
MHTKRIAVGGVKGIKWTATPTGPHRKSECMTLTSILKSLGFADNAKEARKIIVGGMVQVDGIVRKEPNYGAGLMDVVSMPKVGKDVRIVPVKNGIVIKEIPKKEALLKPCKVTGRKLLPGGKVQVQLHDGSSIISDGKFKVNDTLLMAMPDRKIKEVLPYAVGSYALIVSGRHRGEKGQVKTIIEGSAARKSLTEVGEYKTPTEYVFITGKDKPQVEL